VINKVRSQALASTNLSTSAPECIHEAAHTPPLLTHVFFARHLRVRSPSVVVASAFADEIVRSYCAARCRGVGWV